MGAMVTLVILHRGHSADDYVAVVNGKLDEAQKRQIMRSLDLAKSAPNHENADVDVDAVNFIEVEPENVAIGSVPDNPLDDTRDEFGFDFHDIHSGDERIEEMTPEEEVEYFGESPVDKAIQTPNQIASEME
jgi:hypothetical protein